MESCDLVILVFACYTVEKYKNQIETINLTWGKKCETYKNIKLLYFLGEEKRATFEDTDTIKYINLPGVTNDYLSASYKQFLGMKYIYEHYNAKFILSVGTDTYVNIPKLLLFINKFNPSESLYIGGHGCERQIGPKKYYYHSGGPGFIITQSCLEQIQLRLPTLMADWINVCIRNNVRNLITACDVAISYYLQQPEVRAEVVKIDDLSFIHCNYKGVPCHSHAVEPANIISCHLMSRDDFHNFTTILSENNWFV